MPPTRLLRGYLLLWLTTGLILLIASIETVQGAFGAHQANPHVALLGAVEALGAALSVKRSGHRRRALDS